MTSSIVQQETFLDVLLEYMDLDTVDVLLQTSLVCKAWKAASDKFLVTKRGRVYGIKMGKDEAKTEVTREIQSGSSFVRFVSKAWKAATGKFLRRSAYEDKAKGSMAELKAVFIRQWKQEQELFWKGHAGAHPPPPDVSAELEDPGYQQYIDMEHNHEGLSGDVTLLAVLATIRQQQTGHLDIPRAIFAAGGPYLPLKFADVFERDKGFDEEDHDYFIRIACYKQTQDWSSLAFSEGVWRPQGGEHTGKRKREDEAYISADRFRIDEDLRNCIPCGEGVQLRFSMIPPRWSREEAQARASDVRLFTMPRVCIVAVPRTTGECAFIALKEPSIHWNGVDLSRRSSLRDRSPTGKFRIGVYLTSKTDTMAEKCEVVVLITKRFQDEYCAEQE